MRIWKLMAEAQRQKGVFIQRHEIVDEYIGDGKSDCKLRVCIKCSTVTEHLLK